MFDSLTSKFSKAFSSLRSKGRIKSGDIDEIAQEIRTSLLESDVALSVVDDFVAAITERSREALEEVNKSINPSQAIFTIVNEELTTLLGGSARRIRFAKKPPTVILLTGLQGAGKTTLAGKLALHLKKDGNTPLLVASDLQRPNAVTQLQRLGESINIPVFAPEAGNGVGDPVQVAKAGLKFAEDKLHNIVIVDTAGRLGVDEDLMREVSRIRDAVTPDEILFVVDAMVGQDAVRTAQAFNDGVGFDGVVLTKLDGDARGGAALSIVAATGKPIFFASVGEKMEEFELFHPERIASRILGLGDVATLAEQAKRAMESADKGATERLEKKFAEGEDFTLTDFLSQLEAMKNMGSMSKMLSMLPGMAGAGKQIKKQIENFDDAELVRTQAIIHSMTPFERENPKVLNGSRRARIAKGSGRAVSEINNLVDRFTAAQKMMRQMRNGGGMPNMPGMPAMGGMGGMPGLPKGGSKNQPPKKKSRSGNPAKRAAEEA